jgi:hypothetical protein
MKNFYFAFFIWSFLVLGSDFGSEITVDQLVYLHRKATDHYSGLRRFKDEYFFRIFSVLRGQYSENLASIFEIVRQNESFRWPIL